MKLYKYLYILVFILCSEISFGQNVEINGICYMLHNSSLEASVITHADYDGVDTKYSGDIIIPDSITYNSKEYVVDYINSSFKDCDQLTSIKLPNHLVQLGTFSGCTSLQNITIPDNITNIPESAFSGCSTLESITFGNKIMTFGSGAFNYCTNLKSVYIGDLSSWCQSSFSSKTGGYYTGYYTFTSNPLQNGAALYVNGKEIVNLVIPEDINSIPRYAFYGCTSIKTLNVPSHIQSLGDGAFEDCSNLTSAELYFSGTYGDACFGRCTSLNSLYLYGECSHAGISPYVDDSFNGCTNLRKILLNNFWCGGHYEYSSNDPEYLYKVFPYAEEYIIPEGITEIGTCTFQNCESLKSVQIPSTLETLWGSAFAYCKSLKSVYITDLAKWCQLKYSEKANFGSINCANPLNNGADLYLNNNKLTDCVIPENVVKISNYSFCGCTSLSSVKIPSSVSTIESYAFANCVNLEKVELPSTDIIFTSDHFHGCSKLASVGPINSNCNIEYGWQKSIPANAFSYCSSLKKSIISSTINSIGNNAFIGCVDLDTIYTNATTPPSITSDVFNVYGTLFVPCDCYDVYSSTDYWKNFNIIELVDVESVQFSKSQYDIKVGESKALDVTILPAKATYKELYWASEEPSIAKVENGIVYGLKTGVTKVTATTTDGTQISASCTISVTNPVNSVSLDKSELQLEVGDSYTLIATCIPFDADDTNIIWTSKNNSIATVNKGLVTAISVGETVITATSVSGIEASCTVIVEPTIATSISLNEHSVALTTGKTKQLSVSILPDRATSKAVTWNSSNSSIASVSKNGLVTALTNGTAIIIATTTDGSNISDSCCVSVTTLATSITLNKDVSSLIVGQTVKLTANISPNETSNKNVIWQSNNVNSAIVANDGTVTALATGTATISATTSDGTNLTASCIITVTNPVISLTLNCTSAELMVGEQITLTASCTPSNADDTTITWSSSNSNVAEVNNGVVTAKSLGDAIITAHSANGMQTTCTITVVPTPVTSITLNESSINIVKEQQYTLVCTVLPDDATNKEVVWTTSNANVATVSDIGCITAISTGVATITATSKANSKVSASCIVNVTTPITSIKIDNESLSMFVEDTKQLEAICIPSDADNTKIKWESDNNEIAEVSTDGLVTAKNAGTVKITATTTDGTNLNATCNITVKKHSQSIVWDQEISTLNEGGEMFLLDACSSSGMQVKFKSNNDNVISIFDLGNAIYANPVAHGMTTITAVQDGNYKYEPVELTRNIEVVPASLSAEKTLIAYYSPSTFIDVIVVELANQLTSGTSSAYTMKISPQDVNIYNASEEYKQSLLQKINENPNDISSYPSINNIDVNLSDYKSVILVYPLWGTSMAAPMQTFNFEYKTELSDKDLSYIEYDEEGTVGQSANAKVLRLTKNSSDDTSILIAEWLNEKGMTGIKNINSKENQNSDIYDLNGRKLNIVPSHGVYIRNGRKIVK